MNYVFISPHFPSNYKNFAIALKAVCSKPDNGVGAANTYKIRSHDELESFFLSKPHTEYIMEEFIEGELHTYDGLVDTDGSIIFQNSFIFGKGIMETVNDCLDQFYYSQRELPDDLLDHGMAAAGAFRMRGRFFHIEFFRKIDGDLVALEINGRPPGGLSIGMFNYANNIDVYRRYALMVLGKEAGELPIPSYYCGFVGIKDTLGSKQMHSNDEITARYSNIMVTHGHNASVFAGALRNYSYVLKSTEFESLREAAEYILQREIL